MGLFNISLEEGSAENFKETLNLTESGWYPVILSYHFFISFSSLLGNSIVLYGSQKYKAFNVDEVIVVFIECLAISDLLIFFSSTLPILVTLIARQWVLGPVICVIHSYFIFIPGIAQNLIILGISCYKLYYVIKPLSCTISRNRVWMAIKGIYVFSTLYTVLSWSINNQVEFSPYDLSCLVKTESTLMVYYSSFGILFLNFIPSALMIVINITILAVARSASKKHGQHMRKKSVVVISAIAWIYIISSVPKGVSHMILYPIQGLVNR
eukprot:sb/3468216/